MKLAQQEIKATVTVNTSDLGSKKKDDEPSDKDTLARKKGANGACIQDALSLNVVSLVLVVSCCFLSGLLAKDVPLVAVVTEEVKEQLVEASAVTQKAFTTYRREAEAEEHQAAADGTPLPTADKSQDEGEMSVIITIMQPILRLMQLLCENHNRDLQVSLFLSQDFHFASATTGPLLPLPLPPCKRFLICVLILSYHTQLQRNETT